MSSTPIILVTEGGDLCTADCAAWPASAPACVCRLHAAAVRPAALVSDEKRIRGMYATMHYTDWQPLPFFTSSFALYSAAEVNWTELTYLRSNTTELGWNFSISEGSGLRHM